MPATDPTIANRALLVLVGTVGVSLLIGMGVHGRPSTFAALYGGVVGLAAAAYYANTRQYVHAAN